MKRAVTVCLVRPPTISSLTAVGAVDSVPPLGLAYIAGALKEAGFPVTAVDSVGEAVHQYTFLEDYEGAMLHGLTVPQVIARIPPDTNVIAVSAMFSVDWPFVQDLLEAVRDRFPKSLIVVGGEHVTACWEYVLNTCPAVDVCALGEGEETLVELLQARAEQRSWCTVTGIAWREQGVLRQSAPRKRIRDVDAIIEPFWDIFPIHTYIDNALTYGANLGRTMPILASRGCPYRCTFCSSPQMWTQRWLVRNPECVIAEMKKYIARYQVTNFDFYDLTMIIRRDWILAFCKLLQKEDLNVTWQLPAGTRSEAIDAEVAAWLYKSGCRLMNFAPESGSPPELKRMKKQVDLKRMLTSIRAAAKANIQVKGNFIFGIPGMTWGDLLRTFKFMTQMAVAGAHDIGVMTYSPYPGSEIFRDLRKQGKITLDRPYFMELLAYSDIRQGVSYTEGFSGRTLSFLCVLAMLYFYTMSYLFFPQRLFMTLSQLWINEGATKLSNSLLNFKRKLKARRMSLRLGLPTVTVAPLTKPKS